MLKKNMFLINNRIFFNPSQIYKFLFFNKKKISNSNLYNLKKIFKIMNKIQIKMLCKYAKKKLSILLINNQ